MSFSNIKNSYSNAHILVLDDDEDDYFIIMDYLKDITQNSFKIEWARNYTVGLNHILSGAYDLCFVDYRLGAKTGIDFLQEVIKHSCETPIVLLTGVGNYNVDIMAMQYGAYDYLVKTELNSEKLERCIRYVIDRAVAFKALRASEKKYRSIFEKSKDMVFVTDMALNFIDINEAVTSLLGYEIPRALEMNLCDLAENEEERKKLNNALGQAHEINDFEVILSTIDREKKYCFLSVSFQVGDNGDTYMQGIIHDITNLKKIEKATIQSENLAAAGRLARTIAHEVRNPLNNITLSVDQMQHDNEDEELVIYMDIIQRNARRINNLINNLINTSLPAQTYMQQYILTEIMDEVLASSNDRLMLKKIKTVVNYQDSKAIILADKEKIHIALGNIVINAIESMEGNKGILSVTINFRKDFAVLTISDNGCGISEENISRLFEPYFTGKKNGLGLGLTVTLNILQAHKAQIEVTSKIGKGSSFMITFPVKDELL